MTIRILSSPMRLCLGWRQKTHPKKSQWLKPLTRQRSVIYPQLNCCLTSGQRACRAAEVAEKLEWINRAIDRARNRIALRYRVGHDQEGRVHKSENQPPSTRSCHKVLLIGRETTDQARLKCWFEAWQCQVYSACSTLEVIKRTPFTLCNLIVVMVDALIEPADEVVTLLLNHLQSDEANTTKIVALIPPNAADLESALGEIGVHHCLPNTASQGALETLLHHDSILDRAEITDADETIPNVLVIEDHFVQQEILKTWCHNQGVNITLMPNVIEGKAALSDRTFDLIITDMRLPDGDGLELITYARKESSSKNTMTYIVGYTSNVEDFESKCLAVGANHVACKGEAGESDMITWLIKAKIHAHQNNQGMLSDQESES